MADVFELEIKKSIPEEAISWDAWGKTFPFLPGELWYLMFREHTVDGSGPVGFAVYARSHHPEPCPFRKDGHTCGWD